LPLQNPIALISDTSDGFFFSVTSIRSSTEIRRYFRNFPKIKVKDYATVFSALEMLWKMFFSKIFKLHSRDSPSFHILQPTCVANV